MNAIDLSPFAISLLNSCKPTQHFRQRARERHLTFEVEEFVVRWGTEIEARDHKRMFTIVRRDLPPFLRFTRIAEKADGWVVVVAPDGSLITCYRDRSAWKRMRRQRDQERAHR